MGICAAPNKNFWTLWYKLSWARLHVDFAREKQLMKYFKTISLSRPSLPALNHDFMLVLLKVYSRVYLNTWSVWWISAARMDLLQRFNLFSVSPTAVGLVSNHIFAEACNSNIYVNKENQRIATIAWNVHLWQKFVIPEHMLSYERLVFLISPSPHSLYCITKRVQQGQIVTCLHNKFTKNWAH